MIHRPTIVVLDHGSPYSQLVTRRLRELGVFSRLVPATRAGELQSDPDLAGMIVSGAEPASQAVVSFDPAVLEIGRPILAIGHGLGLLCRELGAVFDDAPVGEHSMGTILVETESPLLRGTPRQQQVWMSEGRHVVGV
ncbi:MAG TPA: GMP synthase (glutamine-hydrolyzing), partial [Candidatus Krumholzibacteria bacterium]|nr:GMP synthase (glutamine-hydrolyzing) [Candidatus Krumholzibacteria bacterium]